jgi:hypothetical protein
MKYMLTLSLLATFYAGYSQAYTPGGEKTVLPKLVFDDKGELVITASASSSQHDFDYLVGKWKLAHHKLRSRFTGCKDWDEFETIVLDSNGLAGTASFDIGWATFDGKPWEGRTIRLYNPQTRLWSLYWTASNMGGRMDPPVVGSFENNIGLFFCKDVYKGKPIIMVFKWDKRDPEAPVWSQAFSDDNGKTWEWNWYNTSTRVK